MVQYTGSKWNCVGKSNICLSRETFGELKGNISYVVCFCLTFMPYLAMALQFTLREKSISTLIQVLIMEFI